MKALVLGLVSICLLAGPTAAWQQYGNLETEHLPSYLRDRGEGIPTSMAGTYVQKGQLLVYPFFEYYRDHDYEYAPNELGGTLDEDFLGNYEGFEGLLYFSYGISDRWMIELEGAYISATLETSLEQLTRKSPRPRENGE